MYGVQACALDKKYPMYLSLKDRIPSECMRQRTTVIDTALKFSKLKWYWAGHIS